MNVTLLPLVDANSGENCDLPDCWSLLLVVSFRETNRALEL
jgi:hypothetical protein